jgi:hypothetical protein
LTPATPALCRDGRDIEFVLGGNPDNPLLPAPSYYVIDFNQMRPHNGDAATIISAIVINDPYYPRPGSPYWEAFRGSYYSRAAACGYGELAAEVIRGLEQKWGTLQGSAAAAADAGAAAGAAAADAAEPSSKPSN